MTRRVETIVGGAGISGLAFAHARKDEEVLVLEASERAGGLVRTETSGAFRFELGPETLRVEPDGELARMLDELGVEASKPAERASKRFVALRGRLVEAPLSPPQLLTTPLLSLGGKLRLAREPFRDSRVALDGSIADFARHRVGREAFETLIDPMVSGIHAGDPEQLSMRACFPQLVELVERHGSLFGALRTKRGDPIPETLKPRGGCGAFTEALAKALGSKLVLRTPVSSIAFDGERWLVRSASESFEAPRLALAVPAPTATRLLSTVSPALSRALGSIAAENLVTLVHAWRRADVEHALDGFGYLVPSREGLFHLGTLFSSSIDPTCCPNDHVLLRTMLGGARNPELVDRDDAHLLELVQREVTPLLGLRGAPVFTAIQRWRATLPRFDLQHPERVAAIERSLPPGLKLFGNYLGGIGVSHLVGAARAGAAKAWP